MNYLRELNAFFDWLETNQLEPSAQTLWFHLMATANKSGWPEWFLVSNPLLAAKVGFSEGALLKHRNTLFQKGRIEYIGQGKKKKGKYRIIPFTPHITPNFEVIPEVNREVNREVIPEANHAALSNKQELNEIEKENARDYLLSVMNASKLKGAGAFGLDTMYSYIGVVEVAVIELALKRAEGKHFNYFVSTINDWISNGKVTADLVNPIPQPGTGPLKRGVGKPRMEVVQEKPHDKPISPEEREKMKELARKLKGEEAGRRMRDG